MDFTKLLFDLLSAGMTDEQKRQKSLETAAECLKDSAIDFYTDYKHQHRFLTEIVGYTDDEATDILAEVLAVLSVEVDIALQVDKELGDASDDEKAAETARRVFDADIHLGTKKIQMSFKMDDGKIINGKENENNEK